MLGFQLRANPPPTKATCLRILDKAGIHGCVELPSVLSSSSLLLLIFKSFSPLATHLPDPISLSPLFPLHVAYGRYEVGHTKVFMRYFHIDQLNALLAPIGNAASTLQRVIRGGAARATFQKKLAAKVGTPIMNHSSSSFLLP
jgi:hypothetical protein